MGTCLKVFCLCILITLTVQENPRKLRRRRDVNPTDVKPQDIVEGFSREIKNVGSKVNRVESVQVSDLYLYLVLVIFVLICFVYLLVCLLVVCELAVLLEACANCKVFF